MYVGLRLLLPSEERSVPVARKVLSHALASMGVARECVDDVELAISEACTNVLDHAGAYEEYALSAGIDGDHCVVEVSDEGSGFVVPEPVSEGTLIDPEAEGGRGLQLMRALVDELDFAVCDGGGTKVRLRKSLSYHE